MFVATSMTALLTLSALERSVVVESQRPRGSNPVPHAAAPPALPSASELSGPLPSMSSTLTR